MCHGSQQKMRSASPNRAPESCSNGSAAKKAIPRNLNDAAASV